MKVNKIEGIMTIIGLVLLVVGILWFVFDQTTSGYSISCLTMFAGGAIAACAPPSN